MAQGYQAIGYQLHGPTFATFRWLALGNCRQDCFNLVIDFWKTTCPRALIQRQVRPTIHKFLAGPQYGWDARLEGLCNFSIGLSSIRQQ